VGSLPLRDGELHVKDVEFAVTKDGCSGGRQVQQVLQH
jgi:hypothetical protein